MGVVGALVRHGVRRHRTALLALAGALSVGLAAGLVSLEAAERTEDAYPDYLERAEVADLVVNPVLSTVEAEAAMRDTPGVVDLRRDSLLSVSVGPSDGRVETQDDLAEQYLQARMSSDGRYLDQDRPVISAGRMLDPGADEVVLDEEAADLLGLGVGDPIPLDFYSQSVAGEYTGIGSVEGTVVGIGTFADEVLPDELYPRARLLVSPALGERFDCEVHQPAHDDDRPAEVISAEVLPSDCSRSYAFYSMRVEGGAEGARRVADELSDRFRELNEELPASFRNADFVYNVIPSFSADDRDRVAQSVAPAVVALRTFGITALVATVGVGLLIAGRHLRRRRGDLAVWRSLGLMPGGRAVAAALPLGAGLAGGVAAATALAWIASPVGPIASARTVDPHPGHQLAASTWLAVAASAVALGLGLAVLARRAALHAGRAEAAPRRPLPSLVRSRPFADLGLRAALRGAGAGAVVAGSIVAVTAVAGTVVFDASLLHLVDTPARYGWTADAAAIINAGYGETNAGEVGPTLDDRPEVERWALAAVSGGLDVDGVTLPLIADVEGYDAFVDDSVVIEGHAPTGDGEVALGALTAEDLGVDLGDEVTLTMPYGERTASVSGTVVLPAVGPFESDRSSLGTGVLLPAPLFEAILGQSEEQTGHTGAELARGLGAFVVIDLAEGTDPEAFFDELGTEPVAWGPFGEPPFEYTEPVRPATVLDIAAMRTIPSWLAGALSVALGASVVAGITAGTRGRRRELAVVNAMGATRRQLRRSIRVHSLAVVGAGLLVGLPAGVVLGRLGFRLFAEDLGAAPDPTVPPGLLVTVTVAGLALALGAAALAGRGATAAARRLQEDADRSP